MTLFSSTQARGVFLLAILVALLGCSPVLEWTREKCQVADPATGELRPATAAEIEAAAKPVAGAAGAILVQTGQAEWVPLVDLAVKVGALALAYLIRPRETLVTAAVNGQAKPPPAA